MSILVTKDGSVNLVIPYVNELVTISRNNDALITAIDTHDEKYGASFSFR